MGDTSLLALKKLFKAGHTTLTLDLLMQKLKEMPKLPAKGLACPSTVVRALQWLSMHDESPLCEFDGQHVRSSM